MRKEEYYKIAYKYLGLACTGGHPLGTFRLIDLPEDTLDEVLVTRLRYLHPQLEASRVFKPREFNFLPREQKELVLNTYYLWADGVRTRYVLRYQRFLYLLRNLKTYQPRNWKDWEGSCDEILHAIAECHFVADLNKRGPQYQPTYEGWKNYLRDASPRFHDFLCKPVEARIEERSRLEHTYVCGSTGSGKTTMLEVLIHSYLTNFQDSTVIVIEPAGQLSANIVHWKENVNSDRLVYITYDQEEGLCPIINPFEISGVAVDDISHRARTTKRVVAQELVEALGEVIRGDEDTQFTVNMKATLLPCVLTLLDYEGATLRDLLRFMDDKRNDELIKFAKTRSHDPDAVEFFQTRFKGKESTLAGTKGALYTKLYSVMQGGVLPDVTCGKSTIDLEEAINSRKLIVFDLAKARFGPAQAPAFGRLIVAMLKGMAFRREKIPEWDRVTTHCFIDECQNFVSGSIKTIMEEARKFKIILTLCQTEIGSNMPPDTREAVINGAQMKIAGRAQAGNISGVAGLFPVEKEIVQHLKRGEFILKTGSSNPAVKVTVHSRLVNDQNAMSEGEWQRVWADQVARFYRSADKAATPAQRSALPSKRPAQDPGFI